MSEQKEPQLPQWVNDVGSFLHTASIVIEKLLSAAGTRIPAINANMGLVIFRLIDTLANPIVMGYLASKLAPEDFRAIATLLAGFVGISWSYLNWSISKDLVERAPWTRKMGALIGIVALIMVVSILLDGVVDASWVFILAGRMDLLLTPGIKAYWTGLMGLPFIFSIMWWMTFIASNVADIWSAIKEFKEKNPPTTTPGTDPHAKTGTDPHAKTGTDPATQDTDLATQGTDPAPTTMPCFTLGPAGENPPAEGQYYFPSAPAPHWYTLEEAMSNGVKGKVITGKALPGAAPTPPGEVH
jgi:hypothetical protein